MKTCKRKKSYPSWAKYKATDPDGNVHVFDTLPTCIADYQKYPGYWQDNSVTFNYTFIKTKCAISICKARKSLRLIED